MHRRVLTFVGVALLLAAGRPAAAADDSIPVPLTAFKFKVGDDQASLFGHNEGEGRLFFYTNGAGEATVKVPKDGEYEIVVQASCDPAQNERAKFKLTADGQKVGDETLLTTDEAKDYKLSAKLKAGERKLTIEFTNDVFKEGEFDRNLYVHSVTLKPKK
jgi:Ca-dependent carbohydrate-binding module xylan-binding